MNQRLDAIRRYVKGVAQNTLPLMITCERFEDLLAIHFEGEALTRRQRLLFNLHLFFCRECRDYMNAYERAKTASPLAYAEDKADSPAPEELVDAVMRAYRAS